MTVMTDILCSTFCIYDMVYDSQTDTKTYGLLLMTNVLSDLYDV